MIGTDEVSKVRKEARAAESGCSREGFLEEVLLGAVS